MFVILQNNIHLETYSSKFFHSDIFTQKVYIDSLTDINTLKIVIWKDVKDMKHNHSKIGEYGIRWQPVEGQRTKDGKKTPPHWKKVEFKWRRNN